MTIDWDEQGERKLLRSATGPVMRHIVSLGEQVEQEAKANANNRLIRTVTHDLLNNIKMNVRFNIRDPYVEVGSDATHDNFAYPTYLEKTGHEWLTPALRKYFPEG